MKMLKAFALLSLLFTLCAVGETASAPRAQWKAAMEKGIANRPEQGIESLKKLLASEPKGLGRDEIQMALARLYYQNNNLDLALGYYSMVPKNSDFWLEALEEKAWAYARQRKYEESLSEVETIMSPVLAPQVGPEPYLLASFASLKICDYNGVFKTFKAFKEKFKSRLPELQSLAKTGQSPATARALAKLKQGPATWASLGADVEKLPRFFNRDETLLGRIENLKNAGSSSGAQRLVSDRIKEMANADLSEIEAILKKLHIVEVEAIQRMEMNENNSQSVKSKVANTDNALIFPKDDEVWLDELNHYRVDAKGCPSRGGKKL